MLLPLLIKIFILLLFKTDDVKGEHCEEGWEDKVKEGLNCLFFDTMEANYADAKQFCKRKDANLIELKSNEELKLLSLTMNVMGLPGLWWGGASYAGGLWKWKESGQLLEQWIWGKWGSGANEKYPAFGYTCFVFSKGLWNNGEWKGANWLCNQHYKSICQKR